ncbi:MAG: hypothetical protein IPH75_05825 [bacterium]|nr:hypothetical protein [bacterium]
MTLNHLSRLLYCTIVLALFAFVDTGESVAANRGHVGIRLPYPKSITPPLATDSLFTGFMQPIHLLTLKIDKKGKVQSVSTNQMTTSDWQNRLNSYFRRITFNPGALEGKKSVMDLLVRLTVALPDSQIMLDFPTDTTGRIKEHLLYQENLEHSGAVLPSIARFPWYHAAFKAKDTIRVLPFVLAALTYDDTGRMTGSKLVKTNFPSFAHQILSAMQYGSYKEGWTPDSTAIRSGYLLVTFIPTSHYPTKPWTPESALNADLHDRMTLRMLVDTVGIMIPPLPISRSQIIISQKLPQKYRNSALAVRIRIEDDGSVSTYLSPTNESGLYTFALALEKELRFYPAVGFDGRPRRFECSVEIRPESESSVRISFPWLNSVESK